MLDASYAHAEKIAKELSIQQDLLAHHQGALDAMQEAEPDIWKCHRRFGSNLDWHLTSIPYIKSRIELLERGEKPGC